MKIVKIPAKTYYDFHRKFYSEKAYRSLRLGQAFLNKFFPNLSKPELYYQSDALKADRMIHCELLDFEEKDE